MDTGTLLIAGAIAYMASKKSADSRVPGSGLNAGSGGRSSLDLLGSRELGAGGEWQPTNRDIAAMAEEEDEGLSAGEYLSRCGAGAGTGAMIGTFGGPWGTVIGAVVGCGAGIGTAIYDDW